MISISTAWNYKPEIKARELLGQIKDVGADAVELGYKLTVPQVEELIPLLKEFKLKVSSIHNFCPLPNDSPSPRHPSNHYRLSALDESERRKAVEWTKRAVDTAVRTNGRVVVIHAGTIEVDHDPTEILRNFKAGHSDDQKFTAIRDRMLQEREEKKHHFVDAVKKSLDEVIAYAAPEKILIGLETRYYPTEIPNFQEIGHFLNIFGPDVMGFWHDVGHGEVNVRLGLVKHHQDYFDRYQNRLIGMHIHGVKGIKDHQAPFTGDFDLTPFLPYMKNIIKVIESHSSATAGELKAAIQRLK